MGEIEVADRVNLLRNGRIRFDKEVKDTSLDEITELVISEVRRELAQHIGKSVAGVG